MFPAGSGPGRAQVHTIRACSSSNTLFPRLGKAQETRKHWLPMTREEAEIGTRKRSERESLEAVGRGREASVRRRGTENNGAVCGGPRCDRRLRLAAQ